MAYASNLSAAATALRGIVEAAIGTGGAPVRIGHPRAAVAGEPEVSLYALHLAPHDRNRNAPPPVRGGGGRRPALGLQILVSAAGDDHLAALDLLETIFTALEAQPVLIVDGEQVRLSPEPVVPEQAFALWSALGAEHRPSLRYSAAPVPVSTGARRSRPTARREALDAVESEEPKLRSLIAQARQGPVAALFAGPSGTGKTRAAEVVAAALGREMLRIDLAATIGKYVGETEKRLDPMFDSAEAAGAVLLLDEADALFGKRSEVKDANDRFANVETGFLLRRIENYRGLVILTTNFRPGLDSDFPDRLGTIVRFRRRSAARRRG